MSYAKKLRENGYNAGPHRNGTCVTCGKTDVHTPNGFNCYRCKSSVSLEDKERIAAKDAESTED